MDTERELQGIRYLLNELLLQVYDMGIRLDTIAPLKEAPYVAKREPNNNGRSVSFDLFQLPRDTYDKFVTHYGLDVMNRACVALDNYIKLNGRLPAKNAVTSLRCVVIPKVRNIMKEEQKQSIINP